MVNMIRQTNMYVSVQNHDQTQDREDRRTGLSDPKDVCCTPYRFTGSEFFFPSFPSPYFLISPSRHLQYILIMARPKAKP